MPATRSGYALSVWLSCPNMPTGSSSGSFRRVYRHSANWWWALVAPFIFAASFMTIGAATDKNVSWILPVAMAVAIVVGLIYFVMYLYRTRTIVDGTHLTIVGVHRRRRIAWRDIERIETEVNFSNPPVTEVVVYHGGGRRRRLSHISDGNLGSMDNLADEVNGIRRIWMLHRGSMTDPDGAR